MMEDNDAVGRDIKTLVSLMVKRVSEEDTPSETRCKFVGSNRGKVGIASATKNTKMIECRRRADEALVERGVIECLSGRMLWR